ncbi:hypothetical protein [Nonomuraea sp. NPDC048826]|uniref:hypothetical protein n=1 Tax=Nonomuraea sp. NPDC048826 TaxID=3364347 RepID=UPI00371A3142
MAELEGMVPDGVRQLMEELRQAESSLESAAAELWGLLRGAWLPPGPSNTVRHVASWAGGRIPDVKRRLLLLERLEQARPDLFAGGGPVTVDASLFAPGARLPTMGGFWDQVQQQIQATFDLDQNSGRPEVEMAKGAVEGLGGMLGLAGRHNTVRLVFDFSGWQRDTEALVSDVVSGVIDQPLEVGKALLDWDTWAENPARAFGHLIPDILTGLASGGAGTAATRTTSTAAKVAAKGGWTGKGWTLSPEANAVADQFLARLRQAEKGISRDMRAAGREIGADMEGFPTFTLKSADRLKEKLAKDIQDEANTPVSALVNDIHDGIRYTFTFSEDRYAAGVARGREMLERQGYELLVQKSSWGDKPGGYRGVNTRWRDPVSGEIFEVQFHTPASWHAKQVTHSAYEDLGERDITREDRARLHRHQAEVFEKVPVPPGAEDIPSYRKADKP